MPRAELTEHGLPLGSRVEADERQPHLRHARHVKKLLERKLAPVDTARHIAVALVGPRTPHLFGESLNRRQAPAAGVVELSDDVAAVGRVAAHGAKFFRPVVIVPALSLAGAPRTGVRDKHVLADGMLACILFRHGSLKVVSVVSRILRVMQRARTDILTFPPTYGVVRRAAGTLLDEGGIYVSDDERYRYVLWRRWDAVSNGGLCAWVMLNPSKADEKEPDATITKCIRFSRQWGHAGLVVVNLFGLRATNPKALARSQDPTGPHNATFQRQVLDYPHVKRIVIAWGTFGLVNAADENFMVMNAERELWCLRPPDKDALTAEGAPRHPVRLAYASELVRVRWDGTITTEEA